MSHTNRNFVIAYILLVGLPLVGLAGVLKTGRTIKAPVSIDGTWKIDSTSPRAGGQFCEKAIAALSTSSFAISQSGKTLTVTLHNPAKTSGQGFLEDTNLGAALATTDSSISDCPAGQILILTASIAPNTNPRSMTGSLSVKDCPSCAGIEFHAVRQPKTQGGGSH